MSINPKKDSWVFHGQGYLKTARLHCQQLLNPVHKWSDGNSRVPDRWPVKMDYYPIDLLPTTLFIIHHGIEVFLKSALIGLDIPNASTHNIAVLFENMKTVVMQIQWQPIFTTQEILPQEEIDRIQQVVMPEIEALVDYFARQSMLPDPIDDPNNELFRYPETKKGKIYNANDVANIDVQDLLSKIDLLYEHLNDIGYMISVDARYQPRKIDGQVRTSDSSRSTN